MAARYSSPSMDADAQFCALRARDRRFDGVFFVGVTTTGIYCRPVCPARTPARERCRFFRTVAEAERAGFRACFRCRPEIAPGSAPSDATSRLARAALARIDAGFLNDASVDALGEALGVTGRHVRRVLDRELGASPLEIAESRRLALAKQLLHDTSLPLTDVAFASGWRSLRRFNAAFRARFGAPPSAVRRRVVPPARGGGEAPLVALRLDARPPFDARAALTFLAARAVEGVERVDGDGYARTLEMGGARGVVRVSVAEDRASSLVVRVSPGLVPALYGTREAVRRVFDLDARPDVIADHLGRDRTLRRALGSLPGVRVIGAADAFEMLVRAIVGQQISVSAARTLLGRLAAALGAPLPRADAASSGLTCTFPSAAAIARAPLASLVRLGLTSARAATLHAAARRVAVGRLDLSPGVSPEVTRAALLEIPGVGPWTAEVVAMRGLGDPDAFPAGDLALRRALGAGTSRELERRAKAWSPWRAYATTLLWSLPAREKGRR